MQGVQQSQLAAAFGPENAESEGEDTPGKAARVQIGNALVALLESHRKHRQASLCFPVLGASTRLLQSRHEVTTCVVFPGQIITIVQYWKTLARVQLYLCSVQALLCVECTGVCLGVRRTICSCL